MKADRLIVSRLASAFLAGLKFASTAIITNEGAARLSNRAVELITEAAFHLQTLLGILQRVGDGTTSEQGLQELHRFMKEHSEVETKPVMDRLSKNFHAFVEKGLQRLDRRERTSAAPTLTCSPCNIAMGAVDWHQAHILMLEGVSCRKAP